MENNKGKTTDNVSTEKKNTSPQRNQRSDSPARGRAPNANGRGGRRPRKGGDSARNKMGGKRPKPEFDSRVLSARRVARVVAGGRRFSLSVAVAVGNGKGSVGVGVSKGQDMAEATEKARNQAQKKLIKINLTEDGGITSESIGKYCASIVQIRPSKGFVAGGAVRTIAELAGIQNINAKIQSRSKSHLNNARATLKALQTMKS